MPAAAQRGEAQHPAKRTFQAIRIEVNGELAAIEPSVRAAVDRLKPGGRAAILTFHSGEDRLVKQAFKQGVHEGVYADAAREVIRPSAEECFRNPRARSTKLRWAIRSDRPAD